jgi:hypothetical protein
LAFYTDQPTKNLRFGDVVTGFQLAALHMDIPTNAESSPDLKIHLTRPQYFAVMTPCCSIEMQSFSIAPLVQVRSAFFAVPYFAEDLSRINVPAQPEKAVPPQHWDNLSAEEQLELVNQGLAYAFYDCFVYEPADLFTAYTVRKKKESWTTGHRLVDFKSIFRVECAQIERDRDAPGGIKVYELTTLTRAQLRDKLTAYFGRNADAEIASSAV